MFRPVIATLILILFSVPCVFAQVYQWENHTNKDEVTSLSSFGGFVWATTTGGVVRIAPSNGEVTTYLNSDGLGSIKINFAAFAGDNEAYFGSADGILSRLNLSSQSFNSTQLRSRDGGLLSLNSADTSGDFLWIASSVGIIKYDRVRNGGEVKETYRTLGNFLTESAVNTVHVFDGKIFAGTNEGVAIGDIDNEFLLDPAEWTTIELGVPIFEDIKVTCFGAFNGLLYVGTNSGLYVWDGETSLTPVENFAAMQILDLSLGDEPATSLYALVVTEGGRQVFRISPFEWIIYQLPAELNAGLNSFAYSGDWYFGTVADGVHKILTLNSAVKMPAPGPSSNTLVGGGYDSDGRLLVVSRTDDLSVFVDGDWEYTTVTTSEKLSALVASNGDLWIPTFGRGVFRVKSNGAIQQFNNSNSHLIGVAQDAAFVVVNSVYQDPSGRIWFSLFQANPVRPLVMFDPSDSTWEHFDAADGFVSGNNQVVAAGNGTAAVGVDDQGVAFLRYGISPENHADDQLAYFSRSRRLPSDIVTAMAYDRDNVLWVGTNQGLAKFDEGIDFFFPTEIAPGIGSNITSIVADSRNNIWVGTSEGLALLGRQRGRSGRFHDCQFRFGFQRHRKAGL
ncbi:MAG: hypothetical protein IPH59_16400 [bacterium]|nr:hypothetical protein [bacterium]